MMKVHKQLTDTELEEKFANGTLNPALFDHKAHVRLAWIHISRYGLEKAIENMCAQIRRFAEAHGDKDKFNMTVTVAAVRAVNHFMLRSGARDFESFIKEHPRLIHSFRELLSHHYTTNILRSETAKREYLEPELLPFD
jgi:hypothetical protein